MLNRIHNSGAKSYTICLALVPAISGSFIDWLQVREWVPYNGYSAPELVGAKSCQWSVPTVKRLWFGTTIGINKSNCISL
jgi:hypothetical protein